MICLYNITTSVMPYSTCYHSGRRQIEMTVPRNPWQPCYLLPILSIRANIGVGLGHVHFM